MKVWLKRIGILIAGVFVLGALFIGYFMYRVIYGMPFYETDIPKIEFKESDKTVLLFSKTNGFNHSEAIVAGKASFHKMAERNNWFIYETDEAGVFNAEQLAKFDVVIWNNVSGQVLTKEQRVDFKNYLENGGGLLGIHAAGDLSHQWDWYNDKVLGTDFSHHPINPQLQEATFELESEIDSLARLELAASITLNEEWYIFDSDPREKGAEVLYAMDGNKIIPNGNLLWIKDKNWGMGEFHPNIWAMDIGQGKAIYAAPGHTAETLENENYLKVLEFAINEVSK